MKYSNMTSGTASLRMGTITVWVGEEGLNVRSRDVLGKSIPAVMRDDVTKPLQDCGILRRAEIA